MSADDELRTRSAVTRCAPSTSGSRWGVITARQALADRVFPRVARQDILGQMRAIRVRIENGRITGEAPPGLPEGEVDLALADAADDMTEAELARLNDALERGFEAIKAGRFRPARDVIADLRQRHR